MRYFVYLFSFLFILPNIAKAKNEDFDKNIKKHSELFNNVNSYFIIYATTYISTNTGASAVINAYNDIRNTSKSIPIYLCLDNEGGVEDKNIKWYIEEIYKINLALDTNIIIIVDNKGLNNYLQYEGDIAKVFFVKNNKLIYRENAKHHFISNAQLPILENEIWDSTINPIINHISIKKESQIISQPTIANHKDLKLLNTYKLNTEKIKLSILDFIYPTDGNNMYILTDIENEFIKYNLDSNKIINRFARPHDGAGIFCDIIAEHQAECDTAYKYQKSFLEKLNRKSYYIFHASLNEQEKKILLSIGLQVFIIMKEDLIIPVNDEKEGNVFIAKKGEAFGYGYSLYTMLDSNMQVIENYYAPQDMLPDSGITASWGYGLYFHDSSIISLASPYFDEYVTDFDKMYSHLTLNNNTKKVEFNHYSPAKVSDLYKKNIDASSYVHSVKFDDKVILYPFEELHLVPFFKVLRVEFF